jgi:hypothetical protein
MTTPETTYPLICPHCGGVAAILLRQVGFAENIDPRAFRHTDGRPAHATEPMVCDACREYFQGSLWQMIVAAGANLDIRPWSEGR